MPSRKMIPVSLLILALFVSACSLTPAASPTEAPMPVDLPTLTTDPLVTETATVEVLPSATPDTAVTITAATGSLAIRRGPGTAYDVLGFLQDGQSAVATARDSAGSWLYVPIPSSPTIFGWVSAVTTYSTLVGDINTLEVMTVSPAEPIVIRNCTYHPMLITPLNVLLSPQNEAPGNQTVVLPGDYAAYDQSVSNTQVKTMSLKEGDWVDITTDGLNNTYACP